MLVRIGDGDGASNVTFGRTMSVGEWFDEVPIAAFGYSTVAELFAVRAEATDPASLESSVHWAMVTIVSIYLSVGLTGALAYDDPGANVLDNFVDDNFVALLSFGLVVVITLLYPLINWPTAAALDALYAGPKGTPSFARRRVWTLLNLAAIVTMDALLPSLETAFGLAGALGLGLIAFCLPAAAFLGARSRDGGQKRWWHAAALVIFLAGGTMTIGSTTRIIIVAIQG